MNRYQHNIQACLFFFFVFLMNSCSFFKQEIILSCTENNDLYKVLKENRIPATRYNTPQEAITNAKNGAAVMILADDYPAKTTEFDFSLYETIRNKKIRLYIEFPSSLPGFEIKEIKKTEWERAVISSDVFAPGLEQNRILAIHDCHYVDIPLKNPDIVVARVAGFDNAVFGLPETASPILAQFAQNGESDILVSTTKLSQFITARYAPTDAWTEILDYLIKWLVPGRNIRELKWQPVVAPIYNSTQPLPSDIELTAYKRGIDWYFNSKVVVGNDGNTLYEKGVFPMVSRIGKIPDSINAGDGSFGVLEGFRSSILHDGSQQSLWWRRNDCNGETAGTFALAGVVLNKPDYLRTGGNIGDWLLSSIMTQGYRANPDNPAFGLIGWNDVSKYAGDLDGFNVYYGDDNARTLLGMILTGAALNTNRFDQRILEGLLAILRLSGKKGFVPDRVDHPSLAIEGWEAYHNSEIVSYSGNFQAYLWACYLWAYRQTGYELFLKQAKTGIYNMMDGYPDNWGVTGIQMDRARMLLPLAWLIRIEDMPKHRMWLKKMVDDLGVDPVSGTIPERIQEETNRFGTGHYKFPKTNEEYGITESPIIQEDGDTGTDLLYSVNFAFIGLHEAAEATGDTFYRDVEDKLAEFLCRIQIKSEKHPELDGGWFRAFDYNRWEYWASSGDAGWGAWSIESGWSQSWITITLGLRQLKTSYWDFTSQSQIKNNLDITLNKFFKQ